MINRELPIINDVKNSNEIGLNLGVEFHGWLFFYLSV
jgi:hypothetical protein